MKNSNSKKLLSMALTLVFCLSLVAYIPFTVSAAYEAYYLDGTIATQATFILDPGHGGEDPGSMAAADSTGWRREEADDNLRMALEVARILEENGETVALTRITDKTVALIDRSYIANAGNFAIFFSIHRNSASNTAATGIETYYYNQLSSTSIPAKIAASIHANAIGSSASITDRKVKTANFSVLRETNTYAVLIENLFVSNESDNILFDEIFYDLAKGIAKGLIESKVHVGLTPANLKSTYTPLDLGTDFTASIVQKSSGLMLTNTGSFDTIASAATYDNSQLWKFEKMSRGNEYKLTSLLDGRCLDVASAGTSDGTNLMVWDDNGGNCQRYYFYDVNGAIYIKPVHSIYERVVDISISTNNAQIWECNLNSECQQFVIVKEGETYPSYEKLELKDDSSYSLDSSIVSKVKAETSATVFAANFKNEVKITDIEGIEVATTDNVGTGYVVTCASSNESATIIVLGDIDSDGVLTATDYIRIKSYFLGAITLENEYFTAADIDFSGVIDSTDYLKLKSHFLGAINIYE